MPCCVGCRVAPCWCLPPFTSCTPLPPPLLTPCFLLTPYIPSFMSQLVRSPPPPKKQTVPPLPLIPLPGAGCPSPPAGGWVPDGAQVQPNGAALLRGCRAAAGTRLVTILVAASDTYLSWDSRHPSCCVEPLVLRQIHAFAGGHKLQLWLSLCAAY